MKLFKVLICGGREYNDRVAVDKILTQLGAILASNTGDTMLVIHGGARGADQLAGNIAGARGIHVAEIDALWGRFGNAAGPLRNEIMLALGPDLVIAFPGGRGTADMVRRTREAGKPLWEVGLDGELLQ